jgi:hypothetical protein
MTVNSYAIGFMAIALAGSAVADDSSSAGDLGGKLTMFGATVAGNAAGTIPAYDGGLKVPAGLVPGDGNWPIRLRMKNLACALRRATQTSTLTNWRPGS